jgi:sarcosine oxidase
VTGAKPHDLIVVGLGAYGSAVLYHAARRRMNVVGIDRYTPPHALGSSHGETRVTRESVAEGPEYVAFVRRSHAIWEELQAETGERLLERSGVLMMAPKGGGSDVHEVGDFVGATAEIATRFGVPFERPSGDEIRRRYPQFRVEGEVDGYYEPNAGFLYAERCVREQLTLARRLGAAIRCNEQVVEIAQRGATVAVRTASATYEASRAVIATGAWLPLLLGGKHARALTVQRQVLHWFETTDATLWRKAPVFIWFWGGRPDRMVYGFPALPGASSVKVAMEQSTRTTADEVDRTVGADESRDMYETHIRGRLKGVGPRATAASACLYTVAPGYRFLIDRHPEMDRVTVVSACSGHGFKHSAAIGEAIVEEIVDGRSTLDLSPFRFPAHAS